MKSPEGFNDVFESIEDEPTFEYTFFDYLDPSHPEKIGEPILAQSDIEAKKRFEIREGRAFRTQDGFSRVEV